ncbi:MAG: GNAT family N-acetyltransferase [Bacteroidetes bacterium]|nr:GNAT family N-acetyltransferase [Bacteroidota bacterium]
MNWKIKAFNELNNYELYEILKLRAKVFVVEQNCVFQDMDDKDQKSLHVMGFENDILVAYSRLVSPGVSYKEMSIGRVVTDPDYRRKGMGKELMQVSIEKICEAFGNQPIRIGAQCYLKAFYQSFAFNINSDEYLEDGIPHVEMLRI